MAKLFEVNEVTYNAEKIERVVRMGACCNVQIGGVVVSCGAGYEQFVQLWAQALSCEVMRRPETASELRVLYAAHCAQMAALKCTPDSFESWILRRV